MVTTNLTPGRPFTIPFDSYAYYFAEKPFPDLFPVAVVEHMIAHSPEKPEEIVTSRSGERLFRLPEGQNLPVLAAARMSLSFPLLLSAVPLYLPDHAHTPTPEVPDQAEEIGKQVSRVHADLCWFSDGGICSNFPLHFFDSPLPRWPTFGIDLEPQYGEACKDERNNEDLVWFPPRPGSGAQLPLSRFDQGSSLQKLLGFLGAIVNTMQNWRDRFQATAAGYRDRIVHIQLCPNEGGLNLNMPPEAIRNLSARGKIAGEVIIKHFDFSSHMFARYRITMCALQKYLDDLGNSWDKPVPQDATGQEYIRGTKQAPHYEPRSKKLGARMLQALEQLVMLAGEWRVELANQSFCKDGSPKPDPILRNQPKF